MTNSNFNFPSTGHLEREASLVNRAISILEISDSEKHVVHGGFRTIVNILSIATQISSAMWSAHTQNVFHLDLNLKNILVHAMDQGYPHIVLIDFGVSIKNKDDEKEIADIISSEYYQTYRRPHNYEWPPDEEIKIHNFTECDIVSFGMLLKEIIKEYNLDRTEFIDHIKDVGDPETIWRTIEHLINYRQKDGTKINYRDFEKINRDFMDIFCRMTNSNFNFPSTGHLEREASLVNRAISILEISDSEEGIEKAKELLEKAINIPGTNHICSSYNLELLRWRRLRSKKKSLKNFERKVQFGDSQHKRLEKFRCSMLCAQIMLSERFVADEGSVYNAIQILKKVNLIRDMNFIILENDSYQRAKFYDLLGLAYLLKKEYELAERNFSEAIKLFNHYWLYKMHLCLAKSKTKKKSSKKEIYSLLSEVMDCRYGMKEIKDIIKGKNIDTVEVTIKDLMDYVLTANLDLKSMYRNRKILPSLNFVFDMSSEIKSY
jgi:serine/threonine protein kinase